MGSTPRDPSFKRRFYARCSWDDCTYVGALRKGLCDTHYAALGRELVRAGLSRTPGRYRDAEAVLHCLCPTPRPEQVRVMGGHVMVPGAKQCGHCGRWMRPVEQ
jgi:hypothetical protein